LVERKSCWTGQRPTRAWNARIAAKIAPSELLLSTLPIVTKALSPPGMLGARFDGLPAV
jgi:hypothetical protein